MRFRTRLLLLTLSILLPGFIAGALAVRLVYDEQQDAQKTSMKEAARAFSLLIDNQVQTTEGKLLSLASSPDLQSGQFDSFANHARRVAPPPDTVVVLSSLDGQQLINTRAPAGTALPRINPKLLAMRRAAGPDAVIVSDLFVATLHKSFDYAVEVPVKVDGVVKYRLSMALPVSSLQTLFSRNAFPDNWLAVVLDRNGMVVARSISPEKFVGQRANDSMLQRVLAREHTGINYGRTLEGRDVAAFFSRAPTSNWTVVLAIPIEEIRRPALHAALLMSGTLLIVLGVALAIASTYAQRIVAPIERLGLAAARLGRGEAVTLEATGLQETDEVFEAMAGASQNIAHSKADLQQRVSEAVAVAERAQHALLQGQKLEALGRLTGGIAHDFNNILQTLATALELIKMSHNPAQIHQLAGTCQKAIDRATALTGQMRAFGRVQDVRLEALDLSEALGTVIPLLTSSLPSNIAFKMEVQPDLWPVYVDRLQLELALLNLVINARDAMPSGGHIWLRIANQQVSAPPRGLAPGEYVLLSVADDGAGMAPDVLAHALDPFFTTKPVDQGSGLGLPQAYGFATQSEGTLVLASTVGEGTTVHMYLPRTLRAVSAAAGSARPAGQGSGRVLYVEDDTLVREAIVPALQNAGFDVTAAISGDAALQVLEAGEVFDVLFTDVVMPGRLDGVALARLARARFPDMQVVLATGHTYMQVDLPGVRLLGKPYDLAGVIRMLDQGPGAAAAIPA